MNCKPGDLAILINVSSRLCVSNIGTIVKVKVSAVHPTGDPGWLIEASRPLMSVQGCMTKSLIARDSDLRPIAGLPINEASCDEIAI